MTVTDPNRLKSAARVWYDAGTCVVPAAADGSKRPHDNWKQYQSERPSWPVVEGWLSTGLYDGIGLVCGAVSGNLEMFEIEGRAADDGMYDQLGMAMVEHGYADLWNRLCNGYVEVTPSGGLHWLYRVDGEPHGNLKLARRPSTEAELATSPGEKVKVLIETRGEGGFTIVAPSGGRTHPTAKPWEWKAGGPALIPTLTEDERDALHAVARTFDTAPPEPEWTPKDAKARADGEPLRPGDDYNLHVEWSDVIGPHGWTYGYTTMSGAQGWRRPGKAVGISATIGHGGSDLLYVFSTAAAPFEDGQSYSKFAAYALLEHAGDFSEAASALASQGYGDPLPGPDSAESFDDIYTPPQPPTAEEVRAEGWEPPRSLDLTVPPFPAHVLGWMSEPVERLSDELQTPVDIVGMLLLATVAATIRGRAQVSVGGRWTEPLNVYVAVVAGAGETKSPALSVISKPLREVEKALQDAAKAEVSKNEQARRIQKARLDASERAAAKATADRQSKEIDAEEARRLLYEMPELAVPRILAADTTPEGLVQLLAQQGGVLAVLSAEGGLFDTLAGGRYSSGMANLDAVLQAHDGREPILVDRKGSPPVRVENPRLTLGLAVQPQVLESVGKSEAALGRGFLARFLYSVPATRVGSRRVSAPTSDEGFVDFVDLIRGVEAVVGGGSLDFLDTSPRVDLKLSSSSSSKFYGYRESLEPRRHPSTGDLAAIRAWANKLDGQILRLAGLLQVIYYARDAGNPGNVLEVGVEALSGALDLADYLIHHAVAAHLLIRGDALATSDKAVQLLGWLRKGGHSEFTCAEAHQALKGRLDFRKAEDVKEAADVLEAHGYIRAVAPEPGKVGRPSARYLVNPLEAT
jgi:hypothetical protein